MLASPKDTFDKGPVALQRVCGELQSRWVLAYRGDGHVSIIPRDGSQVSKTHSVDAHGPQAGFDLVGGAELLHLLEVAEKAEAALSAASLTALLEH